MSDAAPAPTIDLLDPATFAAGQPHDLFRWLRAHDPVHRHRRLVNSRFHAEGGHRRDVRVRGRCDRPEARLAGATRWSCTTARPTGTLPPSPIPTGSTSAAPRTSTWRSVGGPHFCLGAHLARVEISALFRELLTRMPDVELAGPVERLPSNFISGPKRMPVRFTPGRAS